jgi:ankyrin repeat protein
MMRTIGIIISLSLLVLYVAAQESKGTYYSDKDYKKMVQGGYLERSPFYPSGNSGQLQLLVMSIDRGDTNVLEKLLDATPDFANCDEGASRCSPVHWAAFKGDTNILGVLVRRRADVKKKGTNWDITALHIARDAKTADLLIQQGADIEAKAVLDQTPLMWAAKRGNLDVAQRLIEKGAKLETKGRKRKHGIVSG